MSYFLQKQAPIHANPETAQMQSGKSMAAPAFQLKAAAPEKTTETGGAAKPAGPYTENVSNLAKITQWAKRAIEEGNYCDTIHALEPLKHDKVEIAHFEEYFRKSIGTDFWVFLGEKWNEESVNAIRTIVYATEKSTPNQEIAKAIRDEIVNKDRQSIFALMGLIVDAAGVSKEYKTLNPGSDLYTDIVAFSTNEFNLIYMADKVFGKKANNEKVRVNNEEEAKEAREIIARIYVEYNIEVNSQDAYDRAMADYKSAPKELLNQIKISTWTLSELKDLEASLAHYKPLLKKQFQDAKASTGFQELETVGKLNKSLQTSVTNNPYVSENIGGEAYRRSNGITLYDNMKDEGFAKRYQSTGKDEHGQVVNKNKYSAAAGVMTHEIGHIFMEKHVVEFAKVGGFWSSVDKANATTKLKVGQGENTQEYTRSLVKGVEAPPTEYACSNADEDLAESVMLYFNNPDILLNGNMDWRKLPTALRVTGVTGNPCPKRYAFIKKIVDGWNAGK